MSNYEILLLNFLAIACPIFLLRPKIYQPNIAQSCIVIPDVTDLIKFTRAMRRIVGMSRELKRFSNSYLGRVVGGAEEAALRFLIDIYADDVASERGISGCQAITMGTVPWMPKQKNRSMSVRVSGEYSEMDIFRAANTYLGQSKFVKNKKGAPYAINSSPIPELVAANLAAERHWCYQFKLLVQDKNDFKRMNFSREGLIKMRKAIKDSHDQAIVDTFHSAWKRVSRQLWDRANDEKLGQEGYFRLLDVRREKIRNEILRARTPDALAGWLLRFCADATKGKSLSMLTDQSLQIREFIFDPRNVDRLQNLLLFALVSYKSEEKNIPNEEGEN